MFPKAGTRRHHPLPDLPGRTGLPAGRGRAPGACAPRRSSASSRIAFRQRAEPGQDNCL